MKKKLDYLQAGGDLKQLNTSELETLCDEIRGFLVESVSKTGGHLASNLGVVELTTAIHKVFDLPADKLIFDVGHQSYVHKLLTGRMDRFDTLRQFGGISGFPKTAESEYDAFDTGHSSTSVSAALGMARVRDLKSDKYNIIALFGDGALTGGEMYEALNDAGNIKTPLILILNDNNMSISKNVGAMSKHLRNIRINRFYFKSKLQVSSFLDKVPVIGKGIKKLMEKIKQSIRRRVVPMTFFEELGFKYIGPLNGHSIEQLVTCLEYAKSLKKPVVVHVCTQKGRGYAPAEKDPSTFHGVGHFDEKTGEFNLAKETYSSRFGSTLIKLADKNEKIIAITCAMPDGTGLIDFSKQFKDRFFDVGIAEQHGVTLAAGMACAGYTPVIPIYSTFLQRAFDQILHDVCLQNLHVVFPVDRAGVVGADGETHQGVYDLSYLSCMPNMTVLSPSSFAQLDEMLDYAINRHSGPIAIRYPRGEAQASYAHEPFEPGKVYIRESGHNVSVITTGRTLITASEVSLILKAEGITAEIVEMPTVYPLNTAQIISAAMKTGYVVTIEDNIKSGGMGEHIAAVLAENNISCKFRVFGYPPVPIVQGKVPELDRLYGIDAKTIASTIIKDIRNGKNKT